MDFNNLQSLLDDQIDWPSDYCFKFIVKADSRDQALGYLDDHSVEERPSRAGNYISITSTRNFETSLEVIEVYKKMSSVKGIISL